MSEPTLLMLADKGLEGFTIQEMTEVFRINDDGGKSKSLGFFRNENIAKGFANCQTDADWHRTGKYWVLTNGKVGFLVAKDPIILLDDEKAGLEIKEKVLAKLSPEEREVIFKLSS
ncbi:MAG: hypothetical protein WC643_03815 [Parcubacteria group bacterium]|jgi:hypothetical protein